MHRLRLMAGIIGRLLQVISRVVVITRFVASANHLESLIISAACQLWETCLYFENNLTFLFLGIKIGWIDVLSYFV